MVDDLITRLMRVTDGQLKVNELMNRDVELMKQIIEHSVNGCKQI